MNALLCLVAFASVHADATSTTWLKVELRPAVRSQVQEDALFLGPERRQALLKQGHGYVDLLRQQDIESTANGTIEPFAHTRATSSRRKVFNPAATSRSRSIHPWNRQRCERLGCKGRMAPGCPSMP